MKKPKADNRIDIDDEMLARFFDAKEAGKSFPDALLVLGDAHVSDAELSELHALWDLHGTLVRSAHNTSPDHALLMRTLGEIVAQPAPGVTRAASSGYDGASAQGAVEQINNNLNLFMNINWKILAPVAVVLIAVVVSTQMTPAAPPDQLAMNDTPESATMATDAQGGTSMMMKTMAVSEAAPVSGNVDDLVASLVLDADQDMSLFADASADIALVSADSQAITELSTAYDETTF